MTHNSILTTDPVAAQRTIDRIRLHEKSIAPDLQMLFPGITLEEQKKIVERFLDRDPIEVWRELLTSQNPNWRS